MKCNTGIEHVEELIYCLKREKDKITKSITKLEEQLTLMKGGKKREWKQ